jgi:3-dehydroquinate synthase class II
VLDADAAAWRVIPAENLVAAFQGSGARLFAAAASADDARVMLEGADRRGGGVLRRGGELRSLCPRVHASNTHATNQHPQNNNNTNTKKPALEVGVSGVLLRTEDPAEVRQLAAYLAQRAAAAAPSLEYARAKVTRVAPVGMADRVCVDLGVNLRPGEGMLVGSFARALFLVHSECLESQYINSRPFRVNAGAVHAYCRAPGGRTAYLSELRSGAEVVVADADGRARAAVVGRCKVEARPMVLVEAVTAGGDVISTLLQNAETVRLIGPAPGGSGSGSGGNGSGSGSGSGSGGAKWRAVSVSELAEGDEVFVLEQAAARHTGIAIEERISEV